MSYFKSIWLAGWLALAGVALVFCFGDDSEPRRSIDLTAASMQAPTSVAIESIEVGDRVMGELSGGEIAGETAVDPASWRKLRLYAEIVWDDGSIDDIHVETLQSPTWIREHKAMVHGKVPLPLDLTEMGLPEGLLAQVVSIEPCPKISDGPGRVVLTTVNHLNRSVYELAIQSSQGDVETLRPTGAHKFYRVSDHAWVSAMDLMPGDTLAGVDGTLAVQRIRHFPGVHRVYNMTVEGEHVYRVAHLGVLVHNNCKIEKHHSDPIFLGGDPKQITTDLPQDVHRGAGRSLHNDLNDFLRQKTDVAGNHMRPQPGNPGARIRENFGRTRRLEAMAEFYKKFRDTYPDAARDFFSQHPHLE